MITLIQNIDVYSPDHLGKKDILITDTRIAAVRENIEIPLNLPELTILDGQELIAVPGFIDNHVHITGGGGEGGFEKRTPEINPADLIEAGVTSVIGVRGTDGFTRSMENLVAKAKGLKKQGISCWILTGSYQVPVRTLTGSIESDILLIEEIIGVGEIAIADHRSSHAPLDDLISLIASARIGGVLSGKAGIVNIHLGDGKNGFSTIRQILEKSDIPRHHIIPTHVNRNYQLLSQGFDYAKEGGCIDLTASGYVEGLDDPRTKCSKALKLALEEGVTMDQVSLSSDGQGSLPVYNQNGEHDGFKVGSCKSLFNEIRDAICQEDIPMEVAVATITRNPARMYRLPGKGNIAPGFDADIVLLSKDFAIKSVISSGRIYNDGIYLSDEK